MYRSPSVARRPSTRKSAFELRLPIGAAGLGVLGLLLIGRLFQLQILEGKTYQVLASDQHTLQAALIPKRGTIFVRERTTGELHPLAQDRDAWQVYGMIRELKDASSTSRGVADALSLPYDEVFAKLSATGTNYVVLAKDVPLEAVDALRAKKMAGIGVNKVPTRWYPEKGVGGQVLGFVGAGEKNDRVGKYGAEGFFQSALAGQPGEITTEKDAAGRRLTIASTQLKEARNGSDIVLTIDRAIQYEACAKIQEAVTRFEARSGTVVIMDPNTGAIMAMCSFPDFDPSLVGKIKDIGTLNNPATFYEYEPGSIFKPITLAAGLDAGKINPDTTYVDNGLEVIDGLPIRNSDKEAHGVQSMKDVLTKSLNTGTIFVQRLLGRELLQKYIHEFGFGKKTGIELKSEVDGDIDSLDRKGKVFAATASYGQGITTTPLQMVQSFAALGNGGRLMKPYIVSEVIRPDGSREITKPQVIRQPIKPQTSRLITAMMVNVVENGHGKRAGVPGYYVAGKTGTAQVSDPRGGYLKDETIGSFAGYAPADNPAFVMLVKIDRPQTVKFAESSAAPIFGELASFLLSYLQVAPVRPIKVVSPPVAPATTSSSAPTSASSSRP